MTSARTRDIVVVGCSAGGVEALPVVLGALPADLPAAVFVVQHISPTATPFLVDILQRQTHLPVKWVEQGDRYANAHVYVAPPTRTCCSPTATSRCRARRASTTHGHRSTSCSRDQVEAALWSAVRALGDRATTLETLAADAESLGEGRTAESYGVRARDARAPAELARTFMLELLKRS